MICVNVICTLWGRLHQIKKKIKKKKVKSWPDGWFWLFFKSLENFQRCTLSHSGKVSLIIKINAGFPLLNNRIFASSSLISSCPNRIIRKYPTHEFFTVPWNMEGIKVSVSERFYVFSCSATNAINHFTGIQRKSWRDVCSFKERIVRLLLSLHFVCWAVLTTVLREPLAFLCFFFLSVLFVFSCFLSEDFPDALFYFYCIYFSYPRFLS